MSFYRLDGIGPEIDPSAWVAPNAVVIGNVCLERQASVWWNAVLRADNDLIRIGENSNIQDGSVLHTDRGIPLVVGKNVTVGHKVMLHGCSIGDESLIGIGSIILNRAVIGRHSLVGAGSLIPEGKVFPERSLILGSPARVVRSLSDEDIARIRQSVHIYIDNARRYRERLRPVQIQAAGDE